MVTGFVSCSPDDCLLIYSSSVTLQRMRVCWFKRRFEAVAVPSLSCGNPSSHLSLERLQEIRYALKIRGKAPSPWGRECTRGRFSFRFLQKQQLVDILCNNCFSSKPQAFNFSRMTIVISFSQQSTFAYVLLTEEGSHICKCC